MSGIIQNKDSVRNKVAAAREAILSSKHTSMAEIYSNMSASDSAVNMATDLAAKNQYTGESTSPIIHTDGTVFQHEDGTYSVYTPQGTTIGGLSEHDAKTFSADNLANQEAIRSNAPSKGSIEDYANWIADGFVGLGAVAGKAVQGS